MVNDSGIHFAHQDIPFGGVGTSGYSCVRGKYGFDNMSHIKPIVIKPNSLTWDKIDIRYPPMNAKKFKKMQGMKGFQGIRQHQIVKGLITVVLLIVILSVLACYSGKIRSTLSAKF